jgi:hypothetical protein
MHPTNKWSGKVRPPFPQRTRKGWGTRHQVLFLRAMRREPCSTFLTKASPVVFLTLCLVDCSHSRVGMATSKTGEQPTALVSARLTDVEAYKDSSRIGPVSELCVTFLDNDRVAFGTLLSSFPDSNAGREFRETIRSNAVLGIVDARSGSIRSVKQWSSMNGEPAMVEKFTLVRDGSGGLLAGIGTQLLRLSSELETLATRTLPLNPTERNGYTYVDSWAILADKAGPSTLLIRFGSDRAVENHWISRETLKDESSTPAPRYSYPSAFLVANQVLFNETYDYLNDHTEHPVLLQQRGSEAHPLCSSCIGAVSASFGNNLILLSTKPSASYAVVDLRGNVLHRATHGKPAEFINRSSGAADTNRVAFLYGHLPTIYFNVFDADLKKEVWEYKLDVQPEKVGSFGVTFTTPRLALSPDGRKLAVLANSVLSIFSIQ